MKFKGPKEDIHLPRLTKSGKVPDNKNFPVRVCPSCNQAWQHNEATSKEWHYLYDFPKLGQRREKCPKC